MNSREIIFRPSRKSVKRRIKVASDDIEDIPNLVKFYGNNNSMMRNNCLNKRNKPKPKDDSVPLHHLKFIEINRKISICDSIDSNLSNSPRSSDATSPSLGHSEVDEMNMMDMDMSFTMESEMNKTGISIPMSSQAMSIDPDYFKFAAHSLPKVAVFKTSTKSNRSSPYSSSLQNSYASLVPNSSPQVQYRGGRKKEAPPALMTDDERRQWEKERLKKDNHNIIEKRRRYKINDCITEIGRLLPPFYDDDILNKKGTILQTAIEYIKKLQTEQNDLKQLRMKYDDLENNNRQLKEALKIMKNVDGNNSMQFLQDVGLFATQSDQSIKQENQLLKETTNDNLNFQRNHSIPVSSDLFDFLKSEHQDYNSLHSKTTELSINNDIVNNLDEPFNLVSSDLLQENISDHHAFDVNTSSLFTLNSNPDPESLLAYFGPSLYADISEDTDFLYNMSDAWP